MITIEREWHTPFGVFGRLYSRGLVLWTVERPWRDNQPWVSCVPVGTYALAKGIHYGAPGLVDDYQSLELRDVPGRTHIEIHIANRARELAGCIGVGMGLGVVGDQWAVTDSKEALDRLIRSWTMADKLTIEGALPARAGSIGRVVFTDPDEEVTR